MNYFDDPLFLRQLIMDHYEHPHNKREEPDYPHKRVSTDSCIDDLTIQARIKDGVVEDVAFIGTACTIATASTSMMTDLLIGKTVTEAQAIITEYNKMIHLKDYDESLLEGAVAFKNVGRQANRVHCATLGWRGIEALIEESGEMNE